jgi:predicted acyl esterase
MVINMEQYTQIREGLKIDFDVPIKMRDGLELRANVYRPIEDGKYPVIMSHGPYGKDLHILDGYSTAYNKLIKDYPETLMGSTNIHMNWETCDPERWCPMGYVCIRIDSRGAGQSPGYMDVWSVKEAEDMYDCIEWAAVQPWSNGKIGLNGISYYACSSWLAAEQQPPHLAAIVAWEGNSDHYRCCIRHGGIYCTFEPDWYNFQCVKVQHGMGAYAPRSRVTGGGVAGEVTLTSEELFNNRVDVNRMNLEHPLCDDYQNKHRVNDFSKIKVPLLSAGNWGGQGLHLKGNVDGYLMAGSEEKWLELHGAEHWTHFYSPYGMDIQKQFLDHYLKGIDNGWGSRKRIQLQVRKVDGTFVERFEDEWPSRDTHYKKLYFDPVECSLTEKPSGKSGKLTYKGMQDEGVTFVTAPLTQEMELTGHSIAKLRVSSESTDADIFLVLRIFRPDFEEVTFAGASDPHSPLSLGWLRASMRKLDEKKSTEFEPWYPFDEKQPLTPGEPVDMTVEIWPTSCIIPKGYRLALTVRGKDYVCEAAKELKLGLSQSSKPLRGVSGLVHDDPVDRPKEIFDKNVTLHFDGGDSCYLQIPVIEKH